MPWHLEIGIQLRISSIVLWSNTSVNSIAKFFNFSWFFLVFFWVFQVSFATTYLMISKIIQYHKQTFSLGHLQMFCDQLYRIVLFVLRVFDFSLDFQPIRLLCFQRFSDFFWSRFILFRCFTDFLISFVDDPCL